MPGPDPTPIDLSTEQRKELELLRESHKKRPRQRAEIVLLAAAGRKNAEIAETVDASVTTVRKWRDRFAEDGVAGLHSDKRMGRPKEKLEVSDAEREELERLARRATTSQQLAKRARMVLLCSEGMLNQDVAEKLGCGAGTVGRWRQRFIDDGIDGLVDEPRPGAPREVNDGMVEDLIVRTLETTPKGATHWSTRSMAKHVDMSPSTIGRIWRAFGLQPHRSETFQLSTDPYLSRKFETLWGCT